MAGKCLDDLAPYGRDLAVASLEWSDSHRDEATGLLTFADRQPNRTVLAVRNSIWYALGLLLRDEGEDRTRACRTISSVLDNQFDEPGTPYHGTFYRWVGEPHPPPGAVIWRDYDPNWRQFIGLGLVMILEEYEDRLPGELVVRMDAAVQKAVVGEPEGRCPPSYSNIALMKAGLAAYAGGRYGREDWRQTGEAFGREVYKLFKEHNTFAEYNSPTYYGVNFYALGFWRKYAGSSTLMDMGRDMEAELWRDIARYYHAGLKNLCGPYTRSYGMDMNRYCALVGLPIWVAVGRGLAPFPEKDIDSEFCYGPCFGILDARVPEEVLPHLKAFSGERQIERQITTAPERVATAWLGQSLMLGAESSGIFYRRDSQFHPATMHWKTPSGSVGWVRLRHIGSVEARAERNRLTISGQISKSMEAEHGNDHRHFIFRVSAEGMDKDTIRKDRWNLPGLTVLVDTNLQEAVVSQGEGDVDIRYVASASEMAGAFTLRVA